MAWEQHVHWFEVNGLLRKLGDTAVELPVLVRSLTRAAGTFTETMEEYKKLCKRCDKLLEATQEMTESLTKKLENE